MGNYELVNVHLANGLGTFERRVNEKLAQGYTALGGPVIIREHKNDGLGNIVQAVIKNPQPLVLDTSRLSSEDAKTLIDGLRKEGHLMHPGSGEHILPSTNIQERGER